MPNDINSVNLVGRLTRNPESFSAGCNLGVAVNDRQKVNDEWVDRPSFFDVTVFGKQADACMEYLSKGSPVAVQGKLRQERWENSDGQNRSKVTITAFTVQFLGSKDDRHTSSDAPADDDFDGAGSSGGDDDDGIPFARPRIPELGERRRDLFAGDRWAA